MKDNKKNKEKVLVITIIIIGILITISGVVILQLQNPLKKKSISEEILTKLSIDNYLKHTLNQDIQINENILNVDSKENMMLYFYSSNTLKHYQIKFRERIDGKPIKFVYARYDEYQKEHQKVFGMEPNLVLDDTALKLTDVVQESGDDYRIESGVGPCDEKTDSKQCYIMLSKYSENKSTITFTDLNMKNNIINGNVKIESKDSKSLDATFEFKYEKDNNNYTIKSLKIKSINN